MVGQFLVEVFQVDVVFFFIIASLVFLGLLVLEEHCLVAGVDHVGAVVDPLLEVDLGLSRRVDVTFLADYQLSVLVVHYSCDHSVSDGLGDHTLHVSALGEAQLHADILEGDAGVGGVDLVETCPDDVESESIDQDQESVLHKLDPVLGENLLEGLDFSFDQTAGQVVVGKEVLGDLSLHEEGTTGDLSEQHLDDNSQLLGLHSEPESSSFRGFPEGLGHSREGFTVRELDCLHLGGVVQILNELVVNLVLGEESMVDEVGGPLEIVLLEEAPQNQVQQDSLAAVVS